MSTINDLTQKSKKWLESKIAKSQVVFAKEDIPQKYYKILLQEKLIAELNKQYIYLKPQFDDEVQVFKNNFWHIIIQFLDQVFNKDWYFTGDYSYKLSFDNFSLVSNQVTIATKAKSNRAINLVGGFVVIATFDPNYKSKPLELKKVLGQEFKVLKPEYILVNATINDYIRYKEELSSLIKSSDRDEKFIVDFFANNSNPVLLARLIGALRQHDDFTLKFELENLLKSSGVKITIPNPFKQVINLDIIERPAYLNRFDISMSKAIEQLASLSKLTRLKTRMQADDIHEIVVDDAYHSLTIEGYTVTRSLLEYLNSHPSSKQNFPDDLRNQLAAKGFMNVVRFIEKILESKFTINENLARKLYEELWKPSLNAKIIQAQDIFRKHMVSINGANYVPPSHEKVPYMIDAIFDASRDIKNGFALGIFLHFFYVGVHPHSDGNGRISRFLMNLAFVNDRYRWLTIPNYEKANYFNALEQSQINDDISYFADYIVSLYKSKPKLK
ncbi:MAG: Fic family protein [Candidatus Caenarcaniphilales bacterium]|nr:Fic family protein [Candidatus Caenarcaniphilales bacterium]